MDSQVHDQGAYSRAVQKTSTSASVQTTRGSQDATAGFSRRLVFIGRQSDQHIVLRRSGIETGRILLRHDGFRRRSRPRMPDSRVTR